MENDEPKPSPNSEHDPDEPCTCDEHRAQDREKLDKSARQCCRLLNKAMTMAFGPDRIDFLVIAVDKAQATQISMSNAEGTQNVVRYVGEFLRAISIHPVGTEPVEILRSKVPTKES